MRIGSEEGVSNHPLPTKPFPRRILIIFSCIPYAALKRGPTAGLIIRAYPVTKKNGGDNNGQVHRRTDRLPARKGLDYI